MGVEPTRHPADTTNDLKAEIATQSETMEWSGSIERTANAMPPICEKCRGSLAFVGKLPGIRLLPLLQVYKCTPCNHVITVLP